MILTVPTAFSVVIALSACGRPAISNEPCVGRGRAIVVSAAEHRLLLCEQGSARGTFRVALGRGGLGKSVEGDRKTPLGNYSVGVPRPSRRFGVFIPIGYPTDEQRRQGKTGSDVGIHGPDRRFAWAGRANTWLNWTSGCLAVASDADIGEIADWVRKRASTDIEIE